MPTTNYMFTITKEGGAYYLTDGPVPVKITNNDSFLTASAQSRDNFYLLLTKDNRLFLPRYFSPIVQMYGGPV
jgi:hypothetical protein